MINPNKCSKPSYAKMESGLDSRKFNYSLQLTAFMNGSPVSYYVDGCSNNYPKLKRVKVRK